MDIRKNPPFTRATTTCSTDNTLELPLDLGNAAGGYYNLLLMGNLVTSLTHCNLTVSSPSVVGMG